MIMQTGRMAAFTGDLEYGAGYMPFQEFPEPFPESCISLVLQPIFNNSGRWAFISTAMPMIDVLTNKGFRVMFPGEVAKSTPHAFMWQAVGY
jgi:hypothetical protein